MPLALMRLVDVDPLREVARVHAAHHAHVETRQMRHRIQHFEKRRVAEFRLRRVADGRDDRPRQNGLTESPVVPNGDGP